MEKLPKISEDDLTQKPDTQVRELSFYSVEELEWLYDSIVMRSCDNEVATKLKLPWIIRISEALLEARKREEGLPFDN